MSGCYPGEKAVEAVEVVLRADPQVQAIELAESS